MTRIPPIIVVTVVGAIAAFCLMRVQFSASLYEMLPRDLPEVRGMDQLNRYFSRDGQLIITVKAEESFIADETMTALATELGSHPELISDVFRELSLTELVTEGGGLLSWLWLNAPPDDFDQLLERLASDEAAAQIADSMLSIQSGFFDQGTIIKSYDPLGFSTIGSSLGGGDSGPDPMTSEDGTFQVMYVEGAGVDFSDYRDAARWLDKVKAVVAEWEAGFDAADSVEIGLTGTPAFMAEVGSEMERDMTISVVATMLLISLLFLIMHRRSQPLAWLVSAMMATLAITITIGGVLFGNLSVMSAGFAAILMGLAVDYGIVLYREAMDTQRNARELRKAVGPSVLWAAATTAIVFLSLNLSSLPGLAEMGNLVAVGVGIGALVMLYGFAPIAVSFNRAPARAGRGIQLTGYGFTRRAAGISAILVPVFVLLSIPVREMPALEANFHPFRIRESPSMKSWQLLQSELQGRKNAVPMVVTGESIPELLRNLDSVKGRVELAESKGLLRSHVLPTSFTPHPENQKRNAEALASILKERSRLLTQISEAGFSEEGSGLTTTIFDSWEDYLGQLETAEYAEPTGKLAVWSIDRLFGEGDGIYAALGTVKPVVAQDREWVSAIADETTSVASLGSLGTALNQRIGEDLRRVFLPMMALLSIMLVVVFRNWRDVVLSLFSIFFSGGVLVLITIWTPMSWNSFNVCGLPLLFGTGLDFSIHMIFALRRSRGEVAAARHGIGKALVFCGTSSAIGFGSLATASAYGLASLGIVCAVGILINMFVAVWLLPRWYRWLHRLAEL